MIAFYIMGAYHLAIISQNGPQMIEAEKVRHFWAAVVYLLIATWTPEIMGLLE